METQILRIVLADDHPIIRDGISATLRKNKQMEIVGEAGNGKELLELLPRIAVDVLIMDIHMPGLSGVQLTEIITRDYPKIGIIIFSGITDKETILAALQAGASGYISKNALQAELSDAINYVVAGDLYVSKTIYQNLLSGIINKNPILSRLSNRRSTNELTPREIEITKLIADGLSYKEISVVLSISVRTVETHRNNIISKLNLKNNSELVKFALRNNLTQS